MATKRKVNRRRRRHHAAPNPRRRHTRRRRSNPVMRRSRRAVAFNPRRRRHHRRRNPGGMRIGQIFKDMIYGAAGAIITRVGAGAVTGLIPGAFASSPLAAPAVQAGVAVIITRWVGKKFMGQQQGDLMMLGGLISAGLALADAYFPSAQAQLTSILRAPISLIPGATPQLPADGSTAMADVYDVPNSVFAGLGGFGDVEDVPTGIFSNVG